MSEQSEVSQQTKQKSCLAPVMLLITVISIDIKKKNISICLRINPFTGTYVTHINKSCTYMHMYLWLWETMKDRKIYILSVPSSNYGNMHVF